MSGSVLTALAAGALGGLMIAAVDFAGLAAVPLIAVALVPTFAVGLSKGLMTATFAFCAAAAMTAVIGNMELMLKYIVLFAAPQAWFTSLALSSRAGPRGTRWYPVGNLIAWLAAIAATGVAAATVIYAGDEGGLVGAIEKDVEFVLRAMVEGQAWRIEETDILENVPVIAGMMPSVMATLWILMMAANGTLAQALVARGGKNLRPSGAFTDLELPDILVYGLTAALALSLLPGDFGFLGRALVDVILVAFFILGLAVVHAFARARPARPLVLLTTYILIAVLVWPAVKFGGALGLAEHVFGLRKRFIAAKKKQEDE